MSLEFEKKINGICNELLNLKTVSEYSSLRSSSTSTLTTVRTGIYRITYQEIGEPIIAKYYIDTISLSWQSSYFMRIFPRTPNGNVQEVEVNTSIDTSDHQSSITYDVNLIILSNRPVTNITRIS